MTSPCRFYLNKIQEVILLSFKIFRFNCCGLDVHKTWIYACIGITDSNGRTDYKQARFSSFSKGLKELCDWLAKYNCSEVCMESTGKYWIPVFNVLEKANNSVILAHSSFKGFSKIPVQTHLYDYRRKEPCAKLSYCF